jgi:phosphohistidine phosphatase
MGRWLRDAGLVPALVLCSTARRARETWQFARPGLAAAPPVTFDGRIYAASAAELLDLVREVPAPVGTLLLIGHNPGIGDLAVLLAADAGTGDLARMRAKFPTAAVAVLRPTGAWRDLDPGRAQLTAFVTPHDLDARPADPA